MHYYIDGYNLLFSLSSLDQDLQEDRNTIILKLCEKTQFLNLDATIVFDATYRTGDAARSHIKDLEIVYTAYGETADAYIIDQINLSADPTKETVVTSDKDLRLHVKEQQGNILSVKEFLNLLNRLYKNKNRGKKAKSHLPIESAINQPNTLFDRYLKIFEENRGNCLYSSLLETNCHPDPFSQEKLIEKKEASKLERRKSSEYERWLEIFEKKYKDGLD